MWCSLTPHDAHVHTTCAPCVSFGRLGLTLPVSFPLHCAGLAAQVARYFGFAQQVGLELGSLMPEELRHTIAFVASLVTMTLNLDQVGLFALSVSLGFCLFFMKEGIPRFLVDTPLGLPLYASKTAQR